MSDRGCISLYGTKKTDLLVLALWMRRDVKAVAARASADGNPQQTPADAADSGQERGRSSK
jgi:hypothetical protein